MMGAAYRLQRAKLEPDHPNGTAEELERVFHEWLWRDDCSLKAKRRDLLLVLGET